MDRTSRQWRFREGTDVYGAEGDKVGSIVSVGPNHLVVEKGFFFPTDYYIPVSAVSRVEEGRVTLNVTKDAALNQGWDAVPADYGTGTVVTTTDTAYETGTLGTAEATTGATAGTYETAPVRTNATIDRAETIAVPVREESLTATKTARELGEVRIEKDVIAEERTLSVPVTEERVRVERRAVDRAATSADAGAFEDAVIEVPVYGEDVHLQKQVRVAEEVEIGKEAVQRTEQVSGTVRREEVRVVGDVVEDASTATVRTTDPGGDPRPGR